MSMLALWVAVTVAGPCALGIIFYICYYAFQAFQDFQDKPIPKISPHPSEDRPVLDPQQKDTEIENSRGVDPELNTDTNNEEANYNPR